MAVMIGGRPCVRYPDLSLYQGRPDMAAIAASRDGCVNKATEGVGITDPSYAPNLAGWRAASGKPWGPYIWIRPGQNGRDQVNRFLQATNNLDGVTIVPSLDVEHQGLTAATVDQAIQALYDAGHARWLGPTGEWVPCRIYTGAWFQLADMPSVAKPADWARFDLWIASYPRYDWIDPDPQQLSLPTVTGPWATWSAWQFAGGNGRQPGVAGECDQSVETVDSFVRSTNPGGSAMALTDDDKNEIRAIVQAEIGKAEADQLGKLAGYEQDTRRYLGRRSIRLNDQPDQYYIADGADGRPVRVHIPNGAVLAALQGTGYVDALPEVPLDPASDAGRWFAALPIVEG